jgi:hypothetical protein
LDPCWTWVRRWTACPSPTCGPPLHGTRRLPDHHDGTPPLVCRHLQARCLNPHPLAHRASAEVGQWPRWSRTWVILRSGPWHTSQRRCQHARPPPGPQLSVTSAATHPQLPVRVLQRCVTPASADHHHPHGEVAGQARHAQPVLRVAEPELAALTASADEDLSLLAHHKCAVPSAGHGHAVARALSFQDPSPLGQRSCSSACSCAARPLPPADNGGLPQQALRQPQLANAPPSASACRTGAEGRRRSLQRLGALLLWFSRFVTPA